MIKRRTFVAATAASILLPAASRAEEPIGPRDVFFDKDIPVLGNPKGNVTIAEFFDYQCSYCKANHPTVAKVVKEDGNVRLVMKDWPVFGPVSAMAAQAVLASAKFDQYSIAQEALLALKGPLTAERIASTLTAAGLDMEKVKAAVKQNEMEISGVLTRNWQQAESLGFQGTPSFVIGKTLYSGVLEEKDLKDALAKARAA
ncbi:DsbA family protein [Allorhizobium sp. BGMRC 0089]|uniref:DsbA family protein n=1 Tax=Allorhizobium sonneratiae TaxID=2934936 RepID=UPI0020339157|nr:DsbA family protein [Allorhizobium sonneratiae]MCM2291525.1 DsbA family protein [Allorhizobium sonneratiae]